MAYIHVKRIGKINYYTLRISERKGGRVVTKDLCTLGTDLSKISLLELEKKYKTKIRKSHKTLKKFLDRNVYVEKAGDMKIKESTFFDTEQMVNIEAVKLHFNTKFNKLDLLTIKEYYELFLIKFAVNSTSIEGNTITLKEADKLLREDIIPKNRSMREAYDLTNTKKVVEYLMDKKPELSLELFIKIHDMLLENIDNRKGLRNHDIHILGQPSKPSPAIYVKADLKLLLKWFAENKNKMHPLALAVIFHHKFENIHPFSDGNGRTGRVLLNHILLSSGYPPLVVSKRFRKEYLNVLNKADKSLKKSLINVNTKDYSALLSFLYSEFTNTYWDTFLV